ncbi:unnamed protein product [Phaeothamnion confervicola]
MTLRLCTLVFAILGCCIPAFGFMLRPTTFNLAPRQSSAAGTASCRTRCTTVHLSAAPDATHEKISALVTANPVIVFMKGNRLMPQCGFSGTLVRILDQLSIQYETVDVLADDRIR